MMRKRLLKIIYWAPDPDSPVPLEKQRPPYNDDVIEAAKTIVMLDFAVLKAEIDNGMYKKPIDAMVHEINCDPLPGEVRTVIIQSWSWFGLIPAATIGKMVPLQEHATGGTA